MANLEYQKSQSLEFVTNIESSQFKDLIHEFLMNSLEG